LPENITDYFRRKRPINKQAPASLDHILCKTDFDEFGNLLKFRRVVGIFVPVLGGIIGMEFKEKTI
jgi:hypothetical protein